jgi:hypothetical protein
MKGGGTVTLLNGGDAALRRVQMTSERTPAGRAEWAGIFCVRHTALILAISREIYHKSIRYIATEIVPCEL